ncbi:MAG: hypothetical protein ACTHJL_10005, partial [Amnibacterium sp.]
FLCMVGAHAPFFRGFGGFVAWGVLWVAVARAGSAAQRDAAARRALATDLIDTGGTLERTIEQTDALWARLHPSGSGSG